MILFSLILPLLVHSHTIKDDVAITGRERFRIKNVCEKMVTHESPLVEIVSGTEIDCMGKKIAVGPFCEKELAYDPYYLRGYVDRKTGEVVCVSGKKVLFKYLCVKLSDKELCSNEAKVSCEFVREKLAKRLDLVHFSRVKNAKGIEELDCQFESLPLRVKNGSL